jgi:hypothetical protein
MKPWRPTRRHRAGTRASRTAEGFGVCGPAARIGVVESIRVDPDTGAPVLLAVRAGLLGNWLVLVPVDQVHEVSMLERRIALRSGGLLAGPRRAA